MKYVSNERSVKECVDSLAGELKRFSFIKPGLHLIKITDECQVLMIA